MASRPVGPARELESLLEDARQLGFLGAAALGAQITHAEGFASSVTQVPTSFLDLGSGGGVPGLVLALRWHRSSGVLLDANRRRAEFLESACRRLGVEARLRVVCERAEVAAHDALLRAQFDVVTARSFGPPSVTVECGSPFLRVGGQMVVSEPPHDEHRRWDAAGLANLGMELEATERSGAGYAVLRRVEPIAERWPRRTGIPTKRPLW